jgi:hypothetical protein
MSCMNFEQAYSGQIISGGNRPHIGLTMLVLLKNSYSTRRSDGYTSSLYAHNYVSNDSYKFVTNLVTCCYHIRYPLADPSAICPIKTDR